MQMHKPNLAAVKLAAAKNYLAANKIEPMSVYQPPRTLADRHAIVMKREILQWPELK